MPTVTKASEVLSGALEFWGTRGERWIAGLLDDGSRACLLGGLKRGAGGIGDSAPITRAKILVLDELESRGHFRGIIRFNDQTTYDIAGRNKSKRFDLVKDVVCHALKRALKEEELSGEESNQRTTV